MMKSSGWIGAGKFPHNKEKAAGILPYSEDF
jgi:hypothetical protein